MTPPFAEWLLAFLITCVVELPIYQLWLRRSFPRRWQAPALGLGLQCATHPALWYLFPFFRPYWLYVTAAESAVVAVEAGLVYLALRVARGEAGRGSALRLAILASLSANALSTGAGLLRYALFDPVA